MTKEEFITKMSEDCEMTKKEANIAYEAVFDTLRDCILSNKEVKVQNLGIIGTKIREAHTARNPKTDEKVNVPEKRVPYFKFSKVLKEELN